MTFASAAHDTDHLAGINQRGPIPDATVHAVPAMIDNTGVVAQIARWRAEDATRSHPGGRPSALDDRAVLIVWTLLAIEHSPLFADRAADLIANRLSPAALTVLGVRQHPASGDDWYDRCWRATHRLLDVIDAYPAPHHRLLTAEEQAAVLATRDPATQQTKQGRADWLCNQLIDGTWALLPRETRRRWNGNTAVDATVVPIFNRPSTKRSPATVDLDAAWYVREGDHRDPGDGQRKGKGKTIWGYEAHIAVATPNTPTTLSDFPLLATGITFDKPGHNIAANALTIYQSMHHRGMPQALAAGDRAYWPNSHADKLQLPMRALGWANVNDYKDTELGIQAGHAGGIMVEGAWYCPSMPVELVEATIDYRARRTIDETTWKQRITARTRYLLAAKERPDSDGHQPMRCPAIGRSATVACPLRPASLGPPTKVSLRSRVTAPPEHPNRICTQTSVSFPPSAGAKHRQDLQFGTTAWADAYAIARNTIEGFNGYIKDGAHEALGDPTRRRLRGRTAQHFLTTLLVVSANIRKIRTFLAEQATPQRAVRRLAAKSRRKRESLADYLPDANAPPGTSATATA